MYLQADLLAPLHLPEPPTDQQRCRIRYKRPKATPMAAAQLDLFELALEALQAPMFSLTMPTGMVSDAKGVELLADSVESASDDFPQDIPCEPWGDPWFYTHGSLPWSKDALVYLQDRLLWASLYELGLESNEHEKWSVLKWVFLPAVRKMFVYDKQIGKSHVFEVHENDEPFSFHNCCIAAGMKDEDAIREGIRRNMPPVVINAVEQVCKY